MSKVLVGVFMAVFVVALGYEMINRTKPDLTKKLVNRFYEGLSSIY